MHHAAGEIVQVNRLQAFHLYQTEAVEGMEGTNHPFHAVGDIGIFRLGRAQILPVEAAVLKNFGIGQLDDRALGGGAAELQPAGDFLAQVDDQFVLGSVNQFHRLDALGDAQGHAQAVFHLGIIVGGIDAHGIGFGSVKGGVVNLAVINGGGANLALGGGPGFVGADHQSGAVGEFHVDFRQQGGVVGVDAGMGIGILMAQAEAGSRPAAAQHEAHGVFAFLQAAGEIEGGHLIPGGIVVVIGSKVFVADFGFAHVQFVDAHGGGVGPGGFHGLVQGDGLEQVFAVARIGSDPLAGPGFAHFAGFKEAFAFGDIAVIGPHGDLPVITGAGGKLEFRHKAQAVNVLALAGIEQGIFQAGAGAHDYLRGGLGLALGLVHFPGKPQGLEGETDGLNHPVGHHVKNAHEKGSSF